MNGQLHDWWARERMRALHEEAASRALVRSLRRPVLLALGDLLTRLGGALTRRASGSRPNEQLAVAVDRVVAARHARGLPHHG